LIDADGDVLTFNVKTGGIDRVGFRVPASEFAGWAQAGAAVGD